MQIDWQNIIDLKELVNKQLQEAINEKIIKSGFDAHVFISAPSGLFSDLIVLGDELKFVLKVSKTSYAFTEGWIKIFVYQISFPKCERCYFRSEEIGSSDEHPTICNRCIDNLSNGKGEQRYFV